MHWESYDIAYVHSVIALNAAKSMLDNLFEFYETNGVNLQEFVPQTLCAGMCAGYGI